jgi:outer membrane receptor protein involved in Fe transport
MDSEPLGGRSERRGAPRERRHRRSPRRPAVSSVACSTRQRANICRTGNITYRKLHTMVDLNGRYQLTSRTSVFFQARNIFNIPEYRYQTDPAIITQYVTFGTILTFGIKGVF